MPLTTTLATAVPLRAPSRPTVADAMITDVKLSGPYTTVREVRGLFDDEHVHAAVIVDADVLVAVVDRADVAENHPDDGIAGQLGSRRTRVVAPDVDLEQALLSLLASGRRRLAVVAPDGKFCGLLCLKGTRTGFCSDRDVRSRARNGRMPK